MFYIQRVKRILTIGIKLHKITSLFLFIFIIRMSKICQSSIANWEMGEYNVIKVGKRFIYRRAPANIWEMEE